MCIHAPSEPPDEWEYSLQVPHDLRGPCVARRTLRVVLEEHGLRQHVDTAELLLSELATNAYRYSSGPALVRLSWAKSRLRVSVSDDNPRLPGLGPAPGPDDDSEGGRGLLLVRLCADDWGGFAIGDEPFGVGGKLLWFELGPAV